MANPIVRSRLFDDFFNDFAPGFFVKPLHGDPREEYPFFLGWDDETGTGAGEGANRNWPLRHGTAWDAFKTFPLRSVPIAAKTGTAEKQNKQDSAVFAAFLPANAPEYAVAVLVEEGGWGGQTAAPVARRIIDGLTGRPLRDVTLARAGTTA